MGDTPANGHHNGHDHPPHLAHHFDTPEQQYDSGKMGMWIFLATEILLFAGLFCAYAVYRANHADIFIYAHHFLDKNLGALNTVVLLCSSFTMAWAVRCSQLGKNRAVVILLSLTLLGGFMFMGVKYVEYKHKWQHGLLWGTKYDPEAGHGETDHEEGAAGHGVSSPAPPEASDPESLPGTNEEAAGGPAAERSTILPSARGPSGTREAAQAGEQPEIEVIPKNVHIFFGVYFLMTGLHGLHVLLGLAAIGWLIFRTSRGDFSPAYFAPVDLVGLYWHLVDLIWIFLFPLLYLIG
jgi:cytochrome c oxidase subunit 3